MKQPQSHILQRSQVHDMDRSDTVTPSVFCAGRRGEMPIIGSFEQISEGLSAAEHKSTVGSFLLTC